MPFVPRGASAFVVVIALGLTSCDRSNLAHLKMDSSVPRPPYAGQIDSLERQAAVANGWIEMVTLPESSVEGRPLVALKVESPVWRDTAVAGRPAVVADEAMHGYEFLGMLVRLPEALVAHAQQDASSGARAFFDGGGVLFMMPILNPDGYSNGARGRRPDDGIDFNRSFPILLPNLYNITREEFIAPEPQAFASYLDAELVRSQLDFKLHLNFHCCNGDGLVFNMVNYTSPPDYPATTVRLKESLARHLYPGMEYRESIYDSEGYIDVYYHAKYDAKSYCIERGVTATPGNESIADVLAFWDDMLAAEAAPRSVNMSTLSR